MAQGGARTKTILFTVLGLVVFGAPFLYSVSQKSEIGTDKVAKAPATRLPEKQLFRGPVTLSDKQILSMTEPYMNALFRGSVTGDYAPLYALGAPEFQRRNPPEKLQQIFSSFWQQNAGLTPITGYMPKQNGRPYFDDNGMLHLVGHYPTEPLQLHYDLTLQAVDGVWRLFGISVKTVPAS